MVVVLVLVLVVVVVPLVDVVVAQLLRTGVSVVAVVELVGRHFVVVVVVATGEGAEESSYCCCWQLGNRTRYDAAQTDC